MPDITFTVTVHVPGDRVDESGGMIASDEWVSERTHRAVKGVPEWTDGREPVEHYAARVLVCYSNSSDRDVLVKARLRSPRRKGRT